MDIVCPICSLDSPYVKTQPRIGRSTAYRCERCGDFTITETAENMVRSHPEMVDTRMSAWIREQKESKRHAPEINEQNLKSIPNNFPTYSITQKQLLLLRKIERDTKHPGSKVSLHPNFDYPIVWATCAEEFGYYVRSLLDRGFIHCYIEDLNELSGEFPFEVLLQPEGWEYLDKHSIQPAFMDQVFVAMSFSNNMKATWEKGIKPAVEKAGYKAYRMDMEPHIDRIDAKIMNEIRNSRFLIADVTEQNQGVYFEAGFALGLGRPVIWSVKSTDKNSVHFDTSHYYHIIWETTEDLKDKLYDLICAVVGKR